MYRHICIPVDSSEYANRAIELAVDLGRAFGAKLTGVHVYAGRLHDSRFKQMEYALPEPYRQEAELERQREVHTSLIAMGLRLISESYLEALALKAEAASLPLERKTFNGKHHTALIADARASSYDLVVMGGLGMGAVKDSQLGSVVERFIRKIATDTLVVRALDAGSLRDGAIVVGLDGSPQSFHGLKVAIALGRALHRPVEAVAVYDPYLHYALFRSIVGVLSADAARVFRFEEQERLHEEIIDTGLAKIYQSHLEIARRLAREEGVAITTTLLAGKCFEKILQHCRGSQPWLLVLGRAGVHSDEDEVELGSNSENLLRLAPCNVLLTGGRFRPPLALQAEETVAWTDEAEARMERVPPRVAGVARAAVLRHALEQGHTVVTSKVIDEVMASMMPGGMAGRVQALAADVAVTRLRAEGGGATAICAGCGYAAKGPDLVVCCPVCGAGADRFRVVDRVALEAAAARQGGATTEEPLPGVTVRWAAGARETLGRVTDAALRRRAQDRIEKDARSQHLPVITLETVVPLIEEIVGRENLGTGWDAVRGRMASAQSAESARAIARPAPSPETLGRNQRAVPLRKERALPPTSPESLEAPGRNRRAVPRWGGVGEERRALPPTSIHWTPEAEARLGRVPAGFMRQMTRQEIEKAARAAGTQTIDLTRCEEWMAAIRAAMCEARGGRPEAGA